VTQSDSSAPLGLYLGFFAKQRAHQGCFSEAEQALARLHEIADLYSYDLARQYYLAISTVLSLERNNLDDAAGAAQDYVDQIQEDAVRIFALGFLARVYVELEQLQAAEEILRQGMAIRKKMTRVLPYHDGTFLRAKLMFELACIDNGESKSARNRQLNQAQRSGRRAWWSATRVAADRPGINLLRGEVAWKRGKRQVAAKLWTRGLGQTEVLRMEPERARLCSKIGEALENSDATLQVFKGRGSSDFLQEASEIRSRLGIQTT
jgi:hypothetical protein